MTLRDFEKYGKGVEKLEAAVESGQVSHAYIFEGEKTIDKEGLALAFARALLCPEKPGIGCGACPTCRKITDGNYEDLYTVKPQQASGKKSKVSSIRDADVEELQERLITKPSAGDRNIAIISSAGLMTKRAQTRFLKTLEEPAPGTVIMLLTENVFDLLPTINSRCVTVRLAETTGEERPELADQAAEILGMIERKSFFFDIKELLDKVISSREDAYNLLYAMEDEIGRDIEEGGRKYGLKACSAAVELIEKTKRTVRANVSYNYAVRALILKLEDII